MLGAEEPGGSDALLARRSAGGGCRETPPTVFVQHWWLDLLLQLFRWQPPAQLHYYASVKTQWK